MEEAYVGQVKRQIQEVSRDMAGLGGKISHFCQCHQVCVGFACITRATLATQEYVPI